LTTTLPQAPVVVVVVVVVIVVVVVVVVVVVLVVAVVIIAKITTAGLTTLFVDSLDCHICHTSDLQPMLILHSHTATGSITVMRYFRSPNSCPNSRYFVCIGSCCYYILYMPSVIDRP
jgi:hypothetical protein